MRDENAFAAPVVHSETPRLLVASACALGEEILWDARSETLVWVDIEDPAIWRYRPATGETSRHACDEKLSFALPTSDEAVFAVGFQSGVALLDLGTGARRPLVRPPNHSDTNRLNSGNVGPDGSLWFGSMDDAEERPTGGYHRWDGAALTTFGGGAAVTNGPVASPDGHRVYTIDTGNGIVRVHDLDGERIGEPRPLLTFPPDWGKPDGLTLDAEGHLWICHYGGSRISRFTPDGRLDRIVPMPTDLVTKCAFGGPSLSTLYVATALRGRDPAAEPMAGHVYVLETPFQGFAASVFHPPA